MIGLYICELGVSVVKIISWNLNGLIASLNNHSFDAIRTLQPDVLCLQEIRTQKEPMILEGYFHYWNHGHQEGHSGTAILTKKMPISVSEGFAGPFRDHEGRVLTVEYPHAYIVNVYVPNMELAGKNSWAELTGDEEFYIKLIRFMDKLPEKYVEEFDVSYQKAANRLVREFTQEFCFEDGSIDWEKLVAFNSGD